MQHEKTVLHGGILRDCFEKVRRNFYERIDAEKHARVYEGLFPEGYAEHEFTGKFLDICAYYYEAEGDARALEKGMKVVRSIAHNMRADGYIGCHEAGKEAAAFSFWGHGFTLYGLVRMYEATGDQEILSLVRRAADFVVTLYANPAMPDILAASNKGSQNISCLYAMGKAYTATGDRRYLDFIGRVLAYCESTDMNLLSFGSIFDLRSQKGIEMLIVFLGVLQYGCLTGDTAALEAPRRYFKEIWESQIRNTGNGTLREVWTQGGNAPRLMATEEKPNETCVAVGWIELALALFFVSPAPVYLDAVEKSVFNHMIGSLEKEGADLAYYQGNYGRKIYRTDDGAYQCCRYRGFTFFTYLHEFLFGRVGNAVYPLLYAPAEYDGEGVRVLEKTNYPAEGEIDFEIENSGPPCVLKLRIPCWCKDYTLAPTPAEMTEDGFLSVALPVGHSSIHLALAMPPRVECFEIAGEPYLTLSRGPLLLARDSRLGGDPQEPLDASATPILREDGCATVSYTLDGHGFVDFASAGGADPQNDTYAVYIPCKKKS